MDKLARDNAVFEGDKPLVLGTDRVETLADMLLGPDWSKPQVGSAEKSVICTDAYPPPLLCMHCSTATLSLLLTQPADCAHTALAFLISSTSSTTLSSCAFPALQWFWLLQVKFGPRQVILVRNNEDLRTLPVQIRESGIFAMTITDAKGLEFEQVLLYNVLSSSEAEWCHILEVLTKMQPDAQVTIKEAILCSASVMFHVGMLRVLLHLSQLIPLYMSFTA